MKAAPWFPGASAADLVVCSDGPQTLTYGRLWRQARAIADWLPPPQPNSQVAFAFGHDRAAFAAALLGTWMAGHTAALPENARRECIVPVLERDEVVAFLHDTGVGRGLFVPAWLTERDAALPAIPAPWSPAGEATAVLAWLPDSAGKTTTRAWTHDELRETTAELCWKLPLLADRTFMAALTPTYVPSLFAGLLAPLWRVARFACGGPAAAETALAAATAAEATGLLASNQLLAAHAEWPFATVAAEGLFAALGLPTEPPPALERLTDPRLAPRDENGRLLHAELHLQLGLGRDGAPIEHELSWQRIDGDGDSNEHRFRTTLPARYAFFEGHFTSYPVLAGAAQLHELLLPCVRAIAPELRDTRRLSGVKFQARIAPGETIDVVLRPVDEHTFGFEIRRGDTRCTSGRIELAAGEDSSR